MRDLLKQTAIDRGPSGYDFEYGFGVVNPPALVDMYTNALDAGTIRVPSFDGGKTEPNQPDTTRQDDIAETRIDTPSNAVASSVQGGFIRLSQNGVPGQNEHALVGLPLGTRAISIWVTEWTQPDNPHASSAVFSTSSVQLYDNGTKCRFIYNLDSPQSRPAAAQYIFGPG